MLVEMELVCKKLPAGCEPKTTLPSLSTWSSTVLHNYNNTDTKLHLEILKVMLIKGGILGNEIIRVPRLYNESHPDDEAFCINTNMNNLEQELLC